MSRVEITQRLIDACIIAIVRAPQRDQVLPAAEALVAGGVTAVEVTMTTPNALDAISELSRVMGNRALIGVGTVLDVATCRAATAVGAQFVVTPICRTDLVAAAHAANCPVMLGAYTPTEAQTAYEAGADFIKVFPADGLGPSYIKALRAPLPHLRIVPTGGVDLAIVRPFLQAGCVALGVGSSLISAPVLRDRDWASLTHKATEFVAAVRAARQGE